jgi:hypothetical protein
MFQEYVSNVSSVLVVCCKYFTFYVLKVDRVQHMLQCALVAAARVSSWFMCGHGMGMAGLVLLLGRRHGSHVGVGARFQMLVRDASMHGAPPWFTCGRGGAVPNVGA